MVLDEVADRLQFPDHPAIAGDVLPEPGLPVFPVRLHSLVALRARVPEATVN